MSSLRVSCGPRTAQYRVCVALEVYRQSHGDLVKPPKMPAHSVAMACNRSSRAARRAGHSAATTPTTTADGRIVSELDDPTRESVLAVMAELDPRHLDADKAADDAAAKRDLSETVAASRPRRAAGN